MENKDQKAFGRKKHARHRPRKEGARKHAKHGMKKSHGSGNYDNHGYHAPRRKLGARAKGSEAHSYMPHKYGKGY